MIVGLGDLGTMAEQHQAWLVLSCPSGYTKMSDADIALPSYVVSQADFCMDKFGNSMSQLSDPSIAKYAAENTRANVIGKIAFAGAAASLLILPGWMKLLSVPLALYGVQESTRGYGF